MTPQQAGARRREVQRLIGDTTDPTRLAALANESTELDKFLAHARSESAKRRGLTAGWRQL